MPFKHGKNAEIWLDSRDVSAFFNDLSLSIDQDTADTSTFKSTWKTAVVGTATGSVDIGGFVDTVNEPFLTSILGTAASVLTAVPSGAAIGDVARLVKVNETSVAESSPIGGAVLVSVTATSTEKIGFGQVLKPWGSQAGTGNGTGKDDAASTSTGWTCHLHVSGVTDVATWVVKLQDSADNTTFADIATFSGIAGAYSGRAVSATATSTLRRYVRWQATRTGGTAPTITFAMSYSRN